MTELALEAWGLSKIYGGGRALGGRPRLAVHAVNNVSMALARGETLGIVGESGCGKSTLARMLANLTRPSTGTIRMSAGGQCVKAPLTRAADAQFNTYSRTRLARSIHERRSARFWRGRLFTWCDLTGERRQDRAC